MTLTDAESVSPGMSDDQLAAHADSVLDQFFSRRN